MTKNNGLVSISFRNKTPGELIALCKEAGLKYIEWGSDVHCPVGNIEYAKELGNKTREAGINTYCYGSYFRVGITDTSEFEQYCFTSVALGAKCIRVWAYNKKYSECSSDELNMIQSSVSEIFKTAKKHNLYINFEYHRGSLTETIDGTLKLFDMVPENNLKVHWQPNPQITTEDNLAELNLLPRVDIVHVFAWTNENCMDIRHPLYNHHLTWCEYVKAARRINPECIFELEFFMGDTATQFIQDAKTLTDVILN